MSFLPPFAEVHREFEGIKWNFFPPDVLPLWVADTDFFAPQPVIDALRERVAHGIFGYHLDSPSLTRLIAERMQQRHGIPAQPEHVLLLPNLVSALSMCADMAGPAGTGILVTTPVYPPFLNSIRLHQQRLVNAPLQCSISASGHLSYEIDFDAIERAITPDTRMWIFCNPHNPVGRSYTRAELERVAEIAVRHNLVVVSDEIHADLQYAGSQHVSLASLNSEIAACTITLNAPSKAFNLPGLGIGYAVITDDALRARFHHIAMYSGQHTSAFGITGALAAYTHGQQYLDEVLPYMQANRDALAAFVAEHLPEVHMTLPESTFLAWLDCRALDLQPSPFQFLLERAKVGLNDGVAFGEGGAGFVRLNFGCSRATLLQALERMRDAIRAR